MDAFSRTRMLIGDTALKRLQNAGVIVFGLGGVGAYVCEALARAGVGRLTLVDGDSIALTNLNRQLLALHSTIGREKTAVMAERIRDIHPACAVTCINQFVLPEDIAGMDFTTYDYVADAIDTVSAKLALVRQCHQQGVPIISSMGTGNKLEPERLRVMDIYETSGCPLARVMRRELRKMGIPGLCVVCSDEEPRKPAPSDSETQEAGGKRSVPGTVSFVPPVAGLLMAGRIIRDIGEI